MLDELLIGYEVNSVQVRFTRFSSSSMKMKAYLNVHKYVCTFPRGEGLRHIYIGDSFLSPSSSDSRLRVTSNNSVKNTIITAVLCLVKSRIKMTRAIE